MNEVDMVLRNEFYRKLDYDKINIRYNKKCIEMNLFLSFLTIDVDRRQDHLGYSTGWTKLTNEKQELIIKGGILSGGVEYLDSIQYKKDLHNPYNNQVSPFNIFDILTNKGKEFFFEYYKDDIEKIRNNIDEKINNLHKQLKKAKELKQEIHNEILKLRVQDLQSNKRDWE